MNFGAFGDEDLGKIYYLSPDSFEWAALGIGYSDFIQWAFWGDLDKFYSGQPWKKWQKEVKKNERR